MTSMVGENASREGREGEDRSDLGKMHLGFAMSEKSKEK